VCMNYETRELPPLCLKADAPASTSQCDCYKTTGQLFFNERGVRGRLALASLFG
jgi:hypothetical protein